MISLSRHIELLLLEHNCVIVPGLGGFITNMASAVYNGGSDGDKQFMPPYRSIGFNPQLQVNDGLLVQSYMQVYDASYPSAYLQMEKEIEQLNTQLDLFGEYTLEGIGTLHKSLGQNIILTAPKSGILTPSLYGTYSFGIKSVEELSKEREVELAASQINIMPIQTESDFIVDDTKKEEPEVNDAPKKEISFKDTAKSKKKRANFWFDFSIAASIAAILFFAFLTSNISSIKGKQETFIAGSPYAQNDIKTPQSSIDKTQPATSSNTEDNNGDTSVTPTQQTPSASTAEANASAANTDSKISAKESDTPKYTIVLASCVTEENSNILIKKLASQGFDKARFVTTGKISRIIYSEYATEHELYQALASLRNKNEVFKTAWPLKME